jgi:hypothetical protein
VLPDRHSYYYYYDDYSYHYYHYYYYYCATRPIGQTAPADKNLVRSACEPGYNTPRQTP